VIEAIATRLAAYEPVYVEHPGARAAVLVPLHECEGELRVVLTKRSETVANHKGEISFPGGAVEEADVDSIATALREAEEEIGLESGHVRIIGRLDDLITISNYHVTAYVGVIEREQSPYVWRPQADEVAEVIEVPLAHLLDAANLIEFPLQRNGETVIREGYRFGEHVIWGATGRMLRNFLEAAVVGLDGTAWDVPEEPASDVNLPRPAGLSGSPI
jgi:8-oxo-dGTP pyrophosphatase MutT (NUDIX family)